MKHIRGLHDTGHVHLDLKLDNMMFDTPKSNDILSYSYTENALLNNLIEGEDYESRYLRRN